MMRKEMRFIGIAMLAACPFTAFWSGLVAFLCIVVGLILIVVSE